MLSRADGDPEIAIAVAGGNVQIRAADDRRAVSVATLAPPGGETGTTSSGTTSPRPKGRPGRKPKGSVPVVVPETPDKPDPDHVLTWRQRKVLQVIRESVQKRGYPPSMREIGEAVGLTSTSSVSLPAPHAAEEGVLAPGRGPAAGRWRSACPGHPAVRPELGREHEDEGRPTCHRHGHPVAGSDLRAAGRADRRGRADPGRAAGRGRLPAAPAAGRRGHPVPA